MSVLAEIWRLIQAVRFSVLFTALFAVLVLRNAEVHDLLWLMAEGSWSTPDDADGHWLLPAALVLLISALFTCWNAFQWGSYALYWRGTDGHPLTPREERLAYWGPRVIGVVPLAALTIGFWQVSFRASPSSTDVPGHLRELALLSGLLCVLTFLTLTFRRGLVPSLAGHGQTRRDTATASEIPDAPRRVTALPPGKLPVAVRVQMASYAILAVVAVLILILSPVTVARTLGSLSLLLLWLGGLIGVSTVLGYASDRLGLPVVGAAALMAVVFSLGALNDNHWLRTVDAPVSAPLPNPAAPKLERHGPDEPPSQLELAIADWLSTRAAGASEEKPFPVFIASAEGGGIRAGYWTGYALARLQDTFPKLSGHLLAISSVSGGSLGAGVFTATVATRPAAPGPEHFTRAHEEYFREEFLSPILAGFLFPDLMQRFLPVPLAVLDRARAFELGLETPTPEGWNGHRPLTGAVNALYANRTAREWPPLLFLNTTRVETGEWSMVTPFRLPPEGFPDTVDLSCLAARIPVSTGIHLTARFPLVSPAGRVDPDARCAGLPGTMQRYVDGGYYDNSGVLTSSRLAQLVRHVAEEYGIPIRIAFLHFSNNPAQGDFDKPPRPTSPEAPLVCGTTAPPREAANASSSYFMGDVLSPVRVMLNVQGASGDMHLRELARRAPCDGNLFLRFRVPSSSTDLPLGWALAAVSKDEMRLAIDECPGIGDGPHTGHDDVPGFEPSPVTCESVEWVEHLLNDAPTPMEDTAE